MEISAAVDFARSHHHAVLHTFRTDGSPQLSPVAVGVDAEGRLVVSTRETAMKTKNLIRDPRAALCILSDGFFGRWVMASGHTEVVHLPDALEPLVDYYRSVSGEHPDWDEYRAAMVAEQRVLVRVSVEQAGPTVSG